MWRRGQPAQLRQLRQAVHLDAAAAAGRSAHKDLEGARGQGQPLRLPLRKVRLPLRKVRLPLIDSLESCQHVAPQAQHVAPQARGPWRLCLRPTRCSACTACCLAGCWRASRLLLVPFVPPVGCSGPAPRRSRVARLHTQAPWEDTLRQASSRWHLSGARGGARARPGRGQGGARLRGYPAAARVLPPLGNV